LFGNLNKFNEHNGNDKRRYVYRYKPWELVCFRTFDNKKDAFAYEKLVKSYKGGNAFKRIINGEVAEWPKALHC
jgi:predicted GIY-YIG superfamily endonuclease